MVAASGDGCVKADDDDDVAASTASVPDGGVAICTVVAEEFEVPTTIRAPVVKSARPIDYVDGWAVLHVFRRPVRVLFSRLHLFLLVDFF